jgi:Leucine-rich repeat (LRR) protein
LKNLSNLTSLDLDKNHLATSDSELITWLDIHYPGWEKRQTSCSGFFTTGIVKVVENAGTVSLTVQRKGDTNGTLEIDYATIEGGAGQGQDYIGATGTLNWADGDATDKTFTIAIIDNDRFDASKAFTVTLTDPVSGENLDNATVIIINDDPIACTTVTEIPSTECDLLITIYNSTNGINWTRNWQWNVTNTPCSWYGVSCSEGHVSGLNLSSNQLTGSIPSELGNLSQLWVLDLDNNQLTGSIPSELGNLSNLTRLWLSYNQLTGSIPRELSNLSQLWELWLSYNQLTSSIPTELGNLTNLTELYLNYNQLTGSIPKELGNLTNLSGFYLYNNQLGES